MSKFVPYLLTKRSGALLKIAKKIFGPSMVVDAAQSRVVHIQQDEEICLKQLKEANAKNIQVLSNGGIEIDSIAITFSSGNVVHFNATEWGSMVPYEIVKTV